MRKHQRKLGKGRVGLTTALTLQAFLLLPFSPARAQDASPHEVGVVYYGDGSKFTALTKETAPQSGHRNYSAKVKGAHAAVRLPAGQPHVFRVCGVDPSRYKLFTFKSAGDARTMTIAKINIWIGGSKSTLSESEIPVTIQTADADCFTIKPKDTLKDGEYGFSPVGDEDAFMFGVGVVRRVK